MISVQYESTLRDAFSLGSARKCLAQEIVALVQENFVTVLYLNFYLFQ